MIPTGALITHHSFVTSSTLGAVLGPLGAGLLVAVVAAFAFFIGALIREPPARRVVGHITPLPRAALPTDADHRRPAA